MLIDSSFFEFDTFEAIAKELGKTDWNFSLNPCDGNPNWSTPKRNDLPQYNNSLLCNCNFSNGTVCHVPQSDLTRNYLNGTIPRSWASMKNLEYLSVTVNRLSNPIPTYLGRIKSLVYVSLESNMFSGKVPAELGKLENLANLVLNANNLSGDLPIELNNLTQLLELRLSSNNFTGKLPNFQSWPSLQYLDLSFNRLEGKIPNFAGLDHMETMYLTGNALTGPIPDWIKNIDARHEIDLSYNNLSQTSEPLDCHETLNLYKSCDDGRQLFKMYNTFYFSFCFLSFWSVEEYYSLHVNCGGDRTTLGSRIFEADQVSGGPAKFVPSVENWGTSSTGDFMGLNGSMSNYLAKNVSVIRANDSQLFTTARLSPLSLTYYGRCLAKGNYTVTLYFAEIVLRDNRSYQSPGRRMFDVHIQGEQRLKDLDVEWEAQGVGKPVPKEYEGVVVDKGILEIRFDYRGKGTTVAPRKGTYGALISAISVESEFSPPSKGKKKIYIAVGTSVAASIIILTSLGIIWRRWYRRNYISREKELKGLDLRTGIFTYRQIQAATENFSAVNKIGEGGFGAVYKALVLRTKGSLLELVDPRLGSNFNEEEALRMIKVALMCTNPSPALRPTMSSVVRLLEGHLGNDDLTSDPSVYDNGLKLQGLRDKYSELQQSSSSQTVSTPSEKDSTSLSSTRI
ncbi:OLC1v1005059C1 [Oldenlandia corymbosa var. corymbosa]|uniref:non-specific serine/threonine protein kinase n=1 Tax=Oldenlandia corymbosa var. corymbosa TaxID=529605 RepID=A0AAV1DFS1_OLDCO|nr:OLC1v1005059C1 [Oldenlandia corymbosa var. corymbosa]